MGSKKRDYKRYEESFDIDLRECTLLGEGNNGIVYMLPDGRVIKIFKKIKNCQSEYSILKAVNGSRYFPRVYGSVGNYIIRDYVGGECMRTYIKKHGLDRRLSINLIKLIETFKKLNFKKLDIRCKDIFVQKDKSLMVIDPKYCFTREKSFPKHLAKGLKKLEVLEDFMEVVKKERPALYEEWKAKLLQSGLIT